jgi:thymidylate kinase
MAEVKPEGDARAFTGQIIQFIASILEPRLQPRPARQRSALVVLVGLDGSGKTTVAREICCQAARTENFRGIRYFHWRPAVFGQAALPLPEFRNVPRKPRLNGNPVRSLLSIARLLKNLVLSNLAYWLRVGPMLRRGGLVLVDRYYYNYYLDPVSVKYYGPSWLLDRLCPFFPRPDLVVVLRAPSEVLLARKQELSAEEISRQIALLDRLPIKAGGVLELDASRPAGEAARDILKELGGVSS